MIIKEHDPAYITIVGGPPPDFREVDYKWAVGVLENGIRGDVALCEMRCLDGPKLVERCQVAWQEKRPSRFDFPNGNGGRTELDIIAIRWTEVEEGHKVFLWLKI